MDEIQQPTMDGGKKWSIWRIVKWVLLALVILLLVVFFMSAVKYEALVQVIDEDRIGVNPTSEKLDFGDLPRNKSATRTVTLQSGANTSNYIMIFKTGDIADFVDISKNNFTLAPQISEELEFSINIPDSAQYRYYNGKIYIFKLPKFW